MTSPTDFIIAGAIILCGGILLGFWICRLRERMLSSAMARERTAALDSARKEAEAIVRDARLAANEEALKVRAETEQRLGER